MAATSVQIPTARTDTAVYTYGWDTAFAIPVPYVNKAIVDHKSSPASFSASEPTFTVSGSFGDWQVCPGGDGKAVRMKLPLSNVQLKYLSSGKIFNYTDGYVVAEIELHFIPHTGIAASAQDGKPFALVANPAPTSDTDPAFSVIAMKLNPEPGTVSGALVQQALFEWGNANLAQFAHVFSVVNLNRMVDHDQWGFVTPNYTSYAYLNGNSLETSTFAVLCMTGARTGESLDEQVSNSAIPSGSKGGFLISQERTLYDLVRPSIKLAYPGLNDSNFLMNSDATGLYLTDGTSISLPSVEHNGTTYYPKLTRLSVQSNGEILTLKTYTTTDVVAGITATCQSTHWYSVKLKSVGGSQTLEFSESQPADVVHDIHQSEGSVITQLIIAIVAAIVLLLLVILTDGAALVVGGLVVGLVLGANQIVPAAIEKINHDDSPDVSLLLINSVDPIKWTGSRVFLLNYGSLNMSLQLGGDPQFA